jgi:hypothetical protein
MNSKRSIFTLGLGLALASILLWMPGSNYDPALAYKDKAGTPTAASDWARHPRSGQSVPSKEHTTGGQDQIQPGVTPHSAAASAVANGDFENGRDGSWTEYASNGWDIVTNILPVAAHSGSWAAWLGGEHDHISFISQSVTVPSQNSELHYWLWINSEDECGFDYGGVRVNGSNVQVFELCENNNTGGWAARSVDLSAYAGQSVTLEIRVETDSSLFSHLLIDDIAFSGAGGASLTYLPINLKNYWSGYFDDFSDPNSGWITGDNRYFKYGYLNGEYQIYIKMARMGPGITPGPADGRDLYLASDYRVEVDARTASAVAGTYGLRFGIEYSSDSFEAYQVVVWPPSGEFILDKRTMDGTWTTIVHWTYSSAINRGSGTNHIEVERVGSKIEIYMNGVEVANVTDGTLLGSGRDAGLVAYSGDSTGVDVRFDNFAASPP